MEKKRGSQHFVGYEKEIEAMDIEIALNHIQEMQQILDSFKNKLLNSSVVESKNIKGNQLMQDISILHDTITDLGNKYDSSDEIKEKEGENKITVSGKRSTVQVYISFIRSHYYFVHLFILY